MECIATLSPFIPGLEKAIHESIEKNKSVKECFQQIVNNTAAKCFRCESTDYGSLKFIQMTSTSRCSDELIESHYFCYSCRNEPR